MNVSGVRMKAIIAQKSAGYTKSIKRDWQEWKRTKNRKDTYRNTPRENRRRKTERRASVETINTRFDGIGGFCYAAGIPSGIDTGCTIKPLWAAEVEPNCIDITRYRFKDVMHVGSVTELKGDEIQPVDIITFGSPCQDLSIAGKRKGLKGNRSGLFTHAIRIIREMRLATNGKYPTFIIWENVPGAFSSNNGEDFRAVLEKVTNANIPMPASGKWATAGMVRGGEVDTAWRVLDAQYWGVPQRRKRIYLIGDFGG